MHLLLQQREKY